MNPPYTKEIIEHLYLFRKQQFWLEGEINKLKDVDERSSEASNDSNCAVIHEDPNVEKLKELKSRQLSHQKSLNTFLMKHFNNTNFNEILNNIPLPL